MATLSKQGVEVARLTKQTAGIPGLTDATQETRSIRVKGEPGSEGRRTIVLAKHRAHFMPDTYRPNGYWHDYGWEVDRVTTADEETIIEWYVARGWTRGEAHE